MPPLTWHSSHVYVNELVSSAATLLKQNIHINGAACDSSLPIESTHIHFKSFTVKMVFYFILRVIKWTVIIGLLVLAIQFYMLNKSWTFSHEGVAKIVKKHAGMWYIINQ